MKRCSHVYNRFFSEWLPYLDVLIDRDLLKIIGCIQRLLDSRFETRRSYSAVEHKLMYFIKSIPWLMKP